MMAIRHAAKQPKGLAFEIEDLLRMREWADHQGVHMVVRLDHGVDGEEYEEVVVFHANPQTPCFLLIWRSAEAIIVQPLLGRPMAYRSVNHVLTSLVARQDAETTDTATID